MADTKLYRSLGYIDHIEETVLEDSLTNLVARDKALLEIGLGDNVDLDNVVGNLVFPATEHYESVITWDASAHSQITDSGVVTRSGADVTANVVATITIYSESDTKTFAVTVLST